MIYRIYEKEMRLNIAWNEFEITCILNYWRVIFEFIFRKITFRYIYEHPHKFKRVFIRLVMLLCFMLSFICRHLYNCKVDVFNVLNKFKCCQIMKTTTFKSF